MSPVIPVLEDHNLAESEKILLSRSMSASKRLNKSSSIGSMMTLTDLAPSDIDEEEYSQTSDVIAGTEEVEHNKPPSPETAPEPHKHFPLIGADQALKLTDAIQKGDYEELGLVLQRNGLNPVTYLSPGGNLLHVLATFGMASLVPKLLAAGVDINHQNVDGDTPLHVAARNGKTGILEFLLPAEKLDDTIENSEGKTPYQVAKNRQIATAIEYSRSIYINQKTKEMHALVAAENIEGLRALFNVHRNVIVLNVDTPDSHGDTILHVAAKLENAPLVQACLDLGADAYFKNKRHRLPIECTKDEAIKTVLRDAPMRISKGLISNRARMESYLNKWTNYAEGYKKRWFVLEEGILSYYKSQAEYPINCRGSINMQYARVNRHHHDKLRFEVVPIGSGSQKIHIRADNVVDAQRWIIALNQASISSQASSVETVPPAIGTSTTPSSSIGATTTANALDDDGALKNSIRLTTTESYVDIIKQALGNLSELEILLNQHLSSGSGIEPAKLTVDNTLNLMFLIREALLAAEEREEEWRKRWEFERNQKTILEESFRDLATENSRIERVSRLKAAEEAKGKPLLGDVSVETVNDEFFDAIEAELLKPLDEDDLFVSMAKELPLVLFDKTFIAKELAGYPPVKRQAIPSDSSQMPPISLWSILKNAIGKDLSRIPIPVNYSEPVSMLQRLCEEMEYSELLDMAVRTEDPFLRIQYIAAFAASSYSSTDGRVTKPFNPLMGETFEYVSAERGFRYVSEQVSHHPPISACHCESARYILWAEVKVASKFWGKSLELTPEGLTHLIIKGAGENGKGEHYSWKKVKSSVYNIVVGKLWIDHYGTLQVVKHSNGDDNTDANGLVCELDFKATGWRTADPKRVEGRVIDTNGRITHTISGHWNKRLTSTPVDGMPADTIELWHRRPLPQGAEIMYNFTNFTMTLNELSKELATHLCPTDSRFRPDQRAMEEGNFHGANELKVRLEEKQRATRKLLEIQRTCSQISEAASACLPRWFKKSVDADTGLPHWEFNEEYWKAREEGRWNGVPHIFLDD